MFNQKKPPSVSSCHSNLLMQRDGPQGKRPARAQTGPVPLFFQAKGQVGTAGGKTARSLRDIHLLSSLVGRQSGCPIHKPVAQRHTCR